MAKVKMLQQISGTRDGVRWPDVGETVDVPEGEADALVAQGYAEKVGKSTEGEKRTTSAKSKTED